MRTFQNVSAGYCIIPQQQKQEQEQEEVEERNEVIISPKKADAVRRVRIAYTQRSH